MRKVRLRRFSNLLKVTQIGNEDLRFINRDLFGSIQSSWLISSTQAFKHHYVPTTLWFVSSAHICPLSFRCCLLDVSWASQIWHVFSHLAMWHSRWEPEGQPRPLISHPCPTKSWWFYFSHKFRITCLFSISDTALFSLAQLTTWPPNWSLCLQS